MSWELLPVDYTDAVWDGMKKYEPINNDDGTISLKDVTVYSNMEKSFFGAKEANRMNEALNTIMSMVENGTNLYEAFQNYFAGQKVLFETAANTSIEQYNSNLSALRSNATTTSLEFNTYVEQLKDEGNQAIESIKTDYSEEISNFEKEQEKVFDIWFEAMREKLSGDTAGKLQSEIDDINNNRIQLSVSCPEVLIGETITATNGVDTKTATVDESLTVTFGFGAPGKYTLTDSYTGTEITVDALLYGLYPVTVKLGVINVTCPDAMIGKTVACSNGEKTYTRVVGSSKEVVFGVPELGTWEITNNYTEEAINVNVTDYVSYEATLHIAKLTVNCDVAYAGETVSVTNGSLAYSKEVPDTGIVTFDIPVFGTWTVTNTKTTDSVGINVNAYSDYTAQFGLVGIKVVCGNEAFVGETVTVTKGSTSYTKTVTESLEVTFELNGLGTWTVTNSKTSAAIVTKCTQYQTYNVSLNLVTIAVTFTDAAFVGKTVTCTGTSSETKVIGSDLSVSFSVDTGTYTLSNSLTSTTQTVNATEYTTYSVEFALATIVVTCATDDFVGKTITCTDGSTTLSKVVGSDLQVSFSVGLGSWTLYNPVNDENENAISVTEYKTYNFTIEKLNIVTWADGSWEDISKMLEAHYAGKIDISDYWAVGDTKTGIQLAAMSATGVSESHSAQSIDLVIVGFNHDNLSSGGKAAVTLSLKNSLNSTVVYMLNSSDNGYTYANWSACRRRTWMSNVFEKALPTDIRNLIKSVSKISVAANSKTQGDSKKVSTTDRCFLFSWGEMFGSSTSNLGNLQDGEQYSHFIVSSNRPRGTRTWLRSSTYDGTPCFAAVESGYGYDSYTAWNSGFSVAPGFCI